MKRNNRNIVFFILAACLLLCSTSCKKEKETEMVTLKLALEQPTDPSANQKVYLDNQKLVCWYTDDEIKIHNGSSISTSHVLNQTATVAQGTNYTAVYPAANSLGTANTVSNGSVTVTIPAVQTYVEGADGRQNLKDLPMGAYLTSSDASSVPVLMFRNLASLIKVTVENPSSTHPFRVNSIKLSSTNGVSLHGTYKWDFSTSSNNSVPVLDVSNSSSPAYGSEVMLDLNDNNTFDTIGEEGSKTYYIVVAPIQNCSLRIEVRGAVLGNYWKGAGGNSSGDYNGEAIKIRYKEFNVGKNLQRCCMGRIKAEFRTGTGYASSGRFTISAIPAYRYFAHGNIAQDNYDRQLILIHDQYATIGSKKNHEGYIPQYQTFVDLFPYHLMNITAGVNTNQDISQHLVFVYYPNNLSYYEPAGTWEFLNYMRLDYILNTRSVSNNINNARYAKACVNGHNGTILFPDNYRQPNGIAVNNVNTPSANCSENTYSVQKWKLMEAAGAIFLPTTGMMYHGNMTYIGGVPTGGVYDGIRTYFEDQDNSIGYYWVAFDGNFKDFMFSNGNGVFGIQNQGTSNINGSSVWYFAIRPVRSSN